MTPPAGGRHRPMGWILLFALALAERSGALGLWPRVQADEGLWTNSTKNFLLFGDWFMDERKHFLLSPVFHVASLPFFKMFGPSIASARAVSLVAGIAAIGLLYLLVRDLSGNPRLALTAALVLALDQWSVFLSRTALIEPTELVPLLLAAWLATREGPLAAVGAGGALGLALLTKLNAAFFVPVLAIFLLLRDGPRARLLIVLGLGLGLAAAGYFLEYRWAPERFVEAFRFELDGRHFESAARPLVRLGRFALDPGLMARTGIALVREAPFLWVLGLLGAAIETFRRPLRVNLFLLWLLGGSGFFLLQMYQPTRYFFLVIPPLAYFAATVLHRLAAPEGDGRPSLPGLLTYAVFSTAYVAGGFAANREDRLPVVRAWAARALRPDHRVMTAGYFATDLEVRAYAHYYYADTEAHLLESLASLRIDYVITDTGEWRPDQVAWLDRRFPVIARWSFGGVYAIRGSPERPTAGDPRP